MYGEVVRGVKMVALGGKAFALGVYRIRTREFLNLEKPEYNTLFLLLKLALL